METPKPTRLLIFGSCVSRDILCHRLAQTHDIKLVDYYARSSLASLAAAAFTDPLPSCLGSIHSPFQLQMVHRDLCKTFFEDLAQAEYDLLLIDLINERFDVWIAPTGEGSTLSNELVQTGFLDERTTGAVITSGSKKFFLLWEKGWTLFVKRLTELGTLDRLRVNQVFWSKTTKSGKRFRDLYTAPQIAAANKLLTRMYDRIRKDLVSHQFFTFDPDCLVASDVHQGNTCPFHFVDEYYAAALHKLLSTVPADCNDTEVLPAAAISRNTTTPAYDLSIWRAPIHQHPSLESACNAGMHTDGIHQISIAKDQTLDLCMQDMALLEANDEDRVILVGLYGAVENRCGKKAPFFAGLGVARSLRLPVIAVSDPTLALDANLPLAWYAGNADNPNIANILAKALDAIAKHHRARLLIFGGSGGGYAGLLLATLVECRATVVVWNPQTAIADYVPRFVEQYIEAAFPGLTGKASALSIDADNSNLQSNAQRLRQLLNEAGSVHDVRGIKQKSLTDILYLQNRNDWHVAKHAAPYFAVRSWQRSGNASFVEETQVQTGIFFGQWGEGHVPPPKAIVEYVLKNLASGEPVVDVLRALDQGIPDLSESAPFFYCFAADPGFRPEVTTRIEAGRISITCNIGHPEKSSFGVTYAFYLILNGERIAVRWYTVDNHVTFDLPATPGKLEVVAFVLDGLANKVITRVPVPAAYAVEGLGIKGQTISSSTAQTITN